ncbi:MAG: hypothetical protein HOQ05_12995 [Corynebacteriales bacterium]|nr:hypothetical protein [Mycobacteriales bacterium]
MSDLGEARQQLEKQAAQRMRTHPGGHTTIMADFEQEFRGGEQFVLAAQHDMRRAEFLLAKSKLAVWSIAHAHVMGTRLARLVAQVNSTQGSLLEAAQWPDQLVDTEAQEQINAVGALHDTVLALGKIANHAATLSLEEPRYKPLLQARKHVTELISQRDNFTQYFARRNPDYVRLSELGDEQQRILKKRFDTWRRVLCGEIAEPKVAISGPANAVGFIWHHVHELLLDFSLDAATACALANIDRLNWPARMRGVPFHTRMRHSAALHLMYKPPIIKADAESTGCPFSLVYPTIEYRDPSLRPKTDLATPWSVHGACAAVPALMSQADEEPAVEQLFDLAEDFIQRHHPDPPPRPKGLSRFRNADGAFSTNTVMFIAGAFGVREALTR